MNLVSIIIPTLNEEDNIEQIIRSVLDVLVNNAINGEILIIDDDSRDRTGAIVHDLRKDIPSLRLVVRKTDHGLSQSVVEGFSVATGDYLLVMDADFSHPPALIPDLLRRLSEGRDIVIGSRYLPGGEIGEWPLRRRLISRGAIFLALLMFPSISDPVSGFFAIRKSVITGAHLRPRGYKILLEVLGKGNWQTVDEVPYRFENREAGQSKLNISIIIDFVCQITDIGFHSLRDHQSRAWLEIARVIKYVLVGLSGVVLNTLLLFGLTEYANQFYLVAGAISFEITILSNFLLNDIWTFSDLKGNTRYPWYSRLGWYHVVSFVGIVMYLSSLYGFTTLFGLHYLVSNMIGVVVAFIWNFSINRLLTWKTRYQGLF